MGTARRGRPSSALRALAPTHARSADLERPGSDAMRSPPCSTTCTWPTRCSGRSESTKTRPPRRCRATHSRALRGVPRLRWWEPRFTPTSMSMIGFAASPGTAAEPTCSILTARSPNASRIRRREAFSELSPLGSCAGQANSPVVEPEPEPIASRRASRGELIRVHGSHHPGGRRGDVSACSDDTGAKSLTALLPLLCRSSTDNHRSSFARRGGVLLRTGRAPPLGRKQSRRHRHRT